MATDAEKTAARRARLLDRARALTVEQLQEAAKIWEREFKYATKKEPAAIIELARLFAGNIPAGSKLEPPPKK